MGVPGNGTENWDVGKAGQEVEGEERREVREEVKGISNKWPDRKYRREHQEAGQKEEEEGPGVRQEVEERPEARQQTRKTSEGGTGNAWLKFSNSFSSP